MIALVNFFIVTNILIIAVSVLVSIYMRAKGVQTRIPYKFALYGFYTVLITGFIFTALGPNLLNILDLSFEKSEYLDAFKSNDAIGPTLVVSQKPKEQSVYYIYGLYILVASGIIGLIQFLISVVLTTRKVRKNFTFRKFGRVSVYVGSEQTMPYVFSLFNKSYVVVPCTLIENRGHLKNVIHHEFQHIRNLDTSFIFALSFFRSIMFLNPCAHSLYNNLRNLHELAVDTEIMSQRKSKSKNYLQSLAWVFEQTLCNSSPQLTNGFFGKNHMKEYIMRIENIKNSGRFKLNIGAVAALVFVGIVGVSCASHFSKEKLAVKSLETQKEEDLFQVQFQTWDKQNVPTTMNIVTKMNEEAYMLNVKDPKWWQEHKKEIDNNMQPTLDEKKYSNWKKITFIVTDRGEDWADVRITGAISEGKEIKRFDIGDRYKLNQTHKIRQINAEIKIDQHLETAKL